VQTEKKKKENPRQENRNNRLTITKFDLSYHVLLLIFELTLMASLPSNLKVTVQLPSKLNQ
jgi:hypothetical protein